MKKTFTILLIIACFALNACATINKPVSVADAEEQTSESVTIIYGDYPVYDNAFHLVDAVDLVFEGKVVGISYEMLDTITPGGSADTGLTSSTPIPYTIFEIKVSDIYKGNGMDMDTIKIKQPGGKIGGEMYRLDNATRIEINQEYLFVAQSFKDSYASFANATQSSYNLNAKETKDASSIDNPININDIKAVFNK